MALLMLAVEGEELKLEPLQELLQGDTAAGVTVMKALQMVELTDLVG